MKTTLVLLLSSLAFALEYGSLSNVLAQSPIHTLRLTELQAKVEAQGPMDQVGSLCYQQLREINQEVATLDTSHSQFLKDNQALKIRWTAALRRYSRSISRNVGLASRCYKTWNRIRTKLPRYTKSMDRMRKRIKRARRIVAIRKRRRARTKAQYEKNMNDFNLALNDLDTIKNILVKSTAFDKTTGANTARQGFLQVSEAAHGQYLEAVDNVKSERFKTMQNRLKRGAKFLQEKQVAEDQASGIDKLMNLIFKVRNELWAEMKKLTAIEVRSVSDHKTWLLRFTDRINRMKIRIALIYIGLGRALTRIGNLMIREANANMRVAKVTKKVDRMNVQLEFQADAINAEAPQYQKLRANKLDEIKTINLMLKILKNLNWSGAVYAAIARIGVSGVDTNPEPGYNLGYQMDLNTGMPTRSAAVYSLASRNIGTFGRVAIKLEIGGAWVWASFDSFSQNPHRYLMPTKRNGIVQQRYVNNLHIFTSVSKKNDIKSGKSARGNLEVWASDTSPRNQLKIPDAQDGSFDWGDRRKIKGFSGCFQVHDFMQQQVLIAVNNLFKQDKHDIGLGNQPMVTNGATKKFVQPDWTGANNFLGHKRRKSKMLLSWYFQKPQAKPKSPKTATHAKKG